MTECDYNSNRQINSFEFSKEEYKKIHDNWCESGEILISLARSNTQASSLAAKVLLSLRCEEHTVSLNSFKCLSDDEIWHTLNLIDYADFGDVITFMDGSDSILEEITEIAAMA